MLHPRELRKRGIWLQRRIGQHLVIDQAVLERMVGYAEIREKDVVLEIGTGTGNLTRLLAQRAKKVITLERDSKLLSFAKERIRRSNVEFILGDALKIEFPHFNKVVANLPYSISSEITFKLLNQGFELAVLMYQLEFARRLMAFPGSEDYGRLTINVYYRATAEILEEVPSEAFFPQPKVSSAIVRLRCRKPPFEVKSEEMFFRVTNALFQHRRQRVRNALYRSFHTLFPDLELGKRERRKTVDEVLPKELAVAHVSHLTPEQIGRIANNLTDVAALVCG
jgi:16S rRNA (adenine1518-N6/adenine1519-N6)-dimethyltransferase